MTNEQVCELKFTLEQNKKELNKLKGSIFAWMLSKNLNKLNKEVKSILEHQVVVPEFAEYEEARVELCKQFAVKDELGKPKVITAPDGKSIFDLDQTNPEFVTAITELREKHADSFVKQDEAQAEFRAFLLMESSIEFQKINIKLVPTEITVELMSLVEEFIED